MGIMVYSILWIMQDFDPQQYRSLLRSSNREIRKIQDRSLHVALSLENSGGELLRARSDSNEAMWQ